MRRRARVAVVLGALSLVVGACGGVQPATIGDTTIRSYVALGDGFAAAPYAGKTDRAKGCLRSDRGYPALLAAKLEIKDATNVSCTYARSEALLRRVEPARGHGGAVPAQLDSLDAKTQLVTLTIGLSDRHVLGDLFSICVKQPCDPDEPTAPTLGVSLARVVLSLQDKLRAIKDKAPDAQLVVVGYPQFLPDEGSCEKMPDLEQAQVDAINALQSRFNDQLSSAARAVGADFVDVEQLAVGHDICADDPWVTGRNARVPYHPEAPLEQAIADEIATDVAP